MAAKRFSHAQCFAHFGVEPKNPRWSWSGKSADGATVAVTLWQDFFTDAGTRYEVKTRHAAYAEKKRPGMTELMENLRHAFDHCDGIVRVIVAIPRDRNATPRAIRECFPHDKLVMKVVSLNEASGEALLVRID